MRMPWSQKPDPVEPAEQSERSLEIRAIAALMVATDTDAPIGQRIDAVGQLKDAQDEYRRRQEG